MRRLQRQGPAAGTILLPRPSPIATGSVPLAETIIESMEDKQAIMICGGLFFVSSFVNFSDYFVSFYVLCHRFVAGTLV